MAVLSETHSRGCPVMFIMAFFDNNAFQKTFSSGDQAVMMVASKNRFFGFLKPDFFLCILVLLSI
jgi:hypothetical protein